MPLSAARSPTPPPPGRLSFHYSLQYWKFPEQHRTKLKETYPLDGIHKLFSLASLTYSLEDWPPKFFLKGQANTKFLELPPLPPILKYHPKRTLPQTLWLGPGRHQHCSRRARLSQHTHSRVLQVPTDGGTSRNTWLGPGQASLCSQEDESTAHTSVPPFPLTWSTTSLLPEQQMKWCPGTLITLFLETIFPLEDPGLSPAD